MSLPPHLRTAARYAFRILLVAAVGWSMSRSMPVWAAVLTITALVLAAEVMAWRWRRSIGGPDQARLFTQAWRTGEVPVEADRERWRQDFHRSDRVARLWWRALVAGTLLLLGVSVLTAVLTGSTGWGLLRDVAVLWAPIVALLLLGLFATRRLGGRTARLRSAVEDEPTE